MNPLQSCILHLVCYQCKFIYWITYYRRNINQTLDVHESPGELTFRSFLITLAILLQIVPNSFDQCHSMDQMSIH